MGYLNARAIARGRSHGANRNGSVPHIRSPNGEFPVAFDVRPLSGPAYDLHFIPQPPRK